MKNALAQCITPLSGTEIYHLAKKEALDEWSEYANEYYSNSGQSVDDVIDTRLAIGLELTDSHHLEYLSDTRVLEALPGGFRYLEKGNREDAALYMRTRSALLELESFGAVRNQPERCVP